MSSVPAHTTKSAPSMILAVSSSPTTPTSRFLYSWKYSICWSRVITLTITGVSGSYPVAPDAKLTPVLRSSGLSSTPRYGGISCFTLSPWTAHSYMHTCYSIH
ncbi:Os03g0859201 [Oryza sativa Japonica Group]|uniref:Os03g0859201 protein n=1 Tax=Oryza sativa subsp. japonica TaxID=39947 RepID=C7IZL7_ORYSJ|nr:Os03g0859201 [Oryza sativa Japonica Group]|eukprot:NP_001173723.1 Os03g0859201 [Oryza sativa Japonica Group]